MVKSMRVAITLEQSWHRVPGGTAVAALETARALRGEPEMELVGVAAFHRKAPPEPWIPPLEVFHLPLVRPLLYESWHRLRRPKVQLACGPVDAIHATTLAIPPRSAPLVVTVHDLAFVHDRSHFTPRGLRFFERGMELAIRDGDVFLCSSEATLRDCVAQGFPENKLRHVPLGVSGEPCDPATVDAVKQRLGLDKPYVLWVGTIEPRKNLGNLLRAFESLDKAHELVLVGPQGWNEDLEPVVAALKDRVKVLGFVAKSDLDGIYAGAEVFCFPSIREGFGFPVLEAMLQGTPVVTSHGTSTEELGQGAAVLVDPIDVRSIAEGIEKVLGDRAFAEELIAAGRDRAATYTWERTAHLTAQAYREAVG